MDTAYNTYEILIFAIELVSYKIRIIIKGEGEETEQYYITSIEPIHIFSCAITWLGIKILSLTTHGVHCLQL